MTKNNIYNNVDNSDKNFLIIDDNPFKKQNNNNNKENENEKKIEYISKLIQLTDDALKKSGMDKKMIKK